MTIGTDTNQDNVRPASVLDGLQTRRKTAEQCGVSERTVLRWEIQGLPVICFGKQRLHNPTSVREWLLRQERRHDEPRRGRPRKAA